MLSQLILNHTHCPTPSGPQIIVDIFEHDYTIETDASGAQDLMFVVFQESNINVS